MKKFLATLATVTVAVVAVAGLSGAQSSQQRLSKPSTAIFTMKRIGGNTDVSRTIHTFKVSDRKGRTVGNFVKVCWFAGSGGVLGSGLYHCNGSFRLARGAIIVSGPIHQFNIYEIAVTGGTGFYAAVGGEVRVTGTKEPGRKLVIFSLIP